MKKGIDAPIYGLVYRGPAHVYRVRGKVSGTAYEFVAGRVTEIDWADLDYFTQNLAGYARFDVIAPPEEAKA